MIGREHCEHVLLCAYYALAVPDEAEDTARNQTGKHFVVKKGHVIPTTRHLGGSVRFFLKIQWLRLRLLAVVIMLELLKSMIHE